MLFIGWENGASFVNQTQSAVKQNQSKREITFDSQLKTTLSFLSLKEELKGELHLHAIFPPLDMALIEISHSRFKQSKNPIIISWTCIVGYVVNF